MTIFYLDSRYISAISSNNNDDKVLPSYLIHVNHESDLYSCEHNTAREREREGDGDSFTLITV